jgi:hypothetical protein
MFRRRVILNWNTIPTKLQRALFEAARTIQGPETAPLRDVLARFLRDHKNDPRRAGTEGAGARESPLSTALSSVRPG